MRFSGIFTLKNRFYGTEVIPRFYRRFAWFF
jgi:hypothetical protein